MTTYSRRSALGLGGAVALALLAAACNDGSGGKGSGPALTDGREDPEGASVELAADDSSAQAYQSGHLTFALGMLAAAYQEAGGNAAVSPLSISQCIALVGQGAAGQTLDEIAKALGCAGAEDLRAGANAEITAVAALPKTELKLASTAFTDGRLPVKEEFTKTVADYFGVLPHAVDFTEPETARAQINQWVAERTNDKIAELLGPGQLTKDTVNVLVNALYLKAKWAAQFDPDATDEGPFTLADGAEITAQFMTDHRDTDAYLDADGSILCALPYEDDDLSALFYLPAEGTTLADAITSLDGGRLDALRAQLTPTDAKLRIPTFEIRQRIELGKALQAAGVQQAFDEEDADFSMMSEKQTYVAFVQHEAWLKVGEKGTEGAAATAAGMEAGAAPAQPEQPMEITLDRPFLFAVRIASTGSLVFAAAIADPSEQ